MAVGCSQLPSPRPLPQGKDYSGVWDSNWGQLTLKQAGKSVHGRYSGFRNGSVSGEADGNVLLFRWTQVEHRQAGRGYFQMDATGDRLEGRWGYFKDRLGGGRWWAVRMIRRR